MKRRLTQDQRNRLAEKVMELGNIAAGALLFGQAISNQPFNPLLAALGILMPMWAYTWAIGFMKGGEQK